jgi:hypothetical protein
VATVFFSIELVAMLSGLMVWSLPNNSTPPDLNVKLSIDTSLEFAAWSTDVIPYSTLPWSCSPEMRNISF